MTTGSKFRQQTKMALDASGLAAFPPQSTGGATTAVSGGIIDRVSTGANKGNGAKSGKLNLSWAAGATGATTIDIKIEQGAAANLSDVSTLYDLGNIDASAAGAKSFEFDLDQAHQYIRVTVKNAAAFATVLAGDLVFGDLDNDSYPDVTTITGA